jgi:folate-dependent phosphoribosylglycinamide formyltransferase PurN
VPFHHVSHEGRDRAQHEAAIREVLAGYDPEFLVLAKYMRVLSPSFVAAYPARIVNIHHSFLPAFVGARPYQQAFDRGVKIIGATAHIVTDDLDTGPIIAQDVRPVTHAHTAADMARAGRDVEKIVLAHALTLLLGGTRLPQRRPAPWCSSERARSSTRTRTSTTPSPAEAIGSASTPRACAPARRMGVTYHVVSVLGSYGHTSPTYFPSPADVSRGNDAMRAMADADRDACRWYVTVNPNHTAHALAEISRGVAAGAFGVKLLASRRADDALNDPICDLAAEHGSRSCITSGSTAPASGRTRRSPTAATSRGSRRGIRGWRSSWRISAAAATGHILFRRSRTRRTSIPISPEAASTAACSTRR